MQCCKEVWGTWCRTYKRNPATGYWAGSQAGLQGCLPCVEWTKTILASPRSLWTASWKLLLLHNLHTIDLCVQQMSAVLLILKLPSFIPPSVWYCQFRCILCFNNKPSKVSLETARAGKLDCPPVMPLQHWLALFPGPTQLSVACSTD